MAKRSSSSLFFFLIGGEPFFFLLALLSIFSLLLNQLATADSHFEGFEADDAEDELLVENEDDLISLHNHHLRSTRLSSYSDSQMDHEPPDQLQEHSMLDQDESRPADPKNSPPTAAFEYWDEDEFEGIPSPFQQHPKLPSESPTFTENATPSSEPAKYKPIQVSGSRSYMIEIVCVSFLIMFAINYFTGKRENENIALAWAAKFATKDSIMEKNFSVLGVGEGEDSPLLLKEGQNVFKFYASGRRFCQGLLATMELKSRHDLISRIYNLVMPCQDEVSFQVFMNDDAMDHVVFALTKKKAAKGMQKEVKDLQRFAGLVSPPSGRKWVAEDLQVISESKEVAGDLITEGVLDQVFGERSFEKHGKNFISMHFSDQHPGTHRKMLLFKFALPDADNMAEMTRLVALIPYYIDLIGRYKLSPQARSKTETARLRVAQEEYKELQNARQEALQKRKAEKKKLAEAEAKLSTEAVRKREAKERARQMKKAMPKMKMTRAH